MVLSRQFMVFTVGNLLCRGIARFIFPGKRQWTRLYVRVKPFHDNYQIRIDGELCRHNLNGHALVVAEVPPIKTPYRQISIQCPEKTKWRLLGFSCELGGNDPG